MYICVYCAVGKVIFMHLQFMLAPLSAQEEQCALTPIVFEIVLVVVVVVVVAHVDV